MTKRDAARRRRHARPRGHGGIDRVIARDVGVIGVDPAFLSAFRRRESNRRAQSQHRAERPIKWPLVAFRDVDSKCPRSIGPCRRFGAPRRFAVGIFRFFRHGGARSRVVPMRAARRTSGPWPAIFSVTKRVALI
nr:MULTISPECIES: hypothetical protein [Burkholderia]